MGGGVRYCTTCRAVYVSDFVRCPNDGGRLDVTDDDPLVGTDVSHYHVDAFIGGGAMGRVYRAHHTLLHHKQVALKVLRGDLAATMAMRLRFSQEAESASRLVHPNVVSVSDFGRTDTGLLFIAMDFIEGRNLADIIITEGPLTATRTIALAQQLCAGLGHAHEQGFVHRDFKPDNIIIVHEDASRATPIPGAPVLPGGERARIVDFGLAIHADPDAAAARLTTAGAAVGTPVYAAPEQMQSMDAVDARADLFALGVTMFEMLAGDVPFDAGLMETLHLNATAERPSISSRAKEPVSVPARLERLVHRLMARVPNERPASTSEVFEELVAIELEIARGVAVIAMPMAPAKRTRWLPFAIASVVIAGGALAYEASLKQPIADPPRIVTAVPPAPAPLVSVAPDRISTPAPVPAPEPAPARVAHPTHGKHKRVAVAAAHDDPPPAPVAEVIAPPDASPAPVPIDASVVAILPAPPAIPIAPRRIATSASVAVESLSVRGALTTAQIRRALDRVTPQVRACYGPAATAAGSSPPISITTRFEIDESQRAHAIELADPGLAGLKTCVQRALANVRAEQAPDVGTVDVAFVLKFTPEGT
jgi:serine/threonine-protein kinase